MCCVHFINMIQNSLSVMRKIHVSLKEKCIQLLQRFWQHNLDSDFLKNSRPLLLVQDYVEFHIWGMFQSHLAAEAPGEAQHFAKSATLRRQGSGL